MTGLNTLWLETDLVGGLLLCASQEGLRHIDFMPCRPANISAPEAWAQPLLHEAAQQIQAYCAGSLRCFRLPLAPVGTAFQQQVWQALLQIPYGATRSYGAVASAIGKPRAARAVGMANNRNPLPIVIPCHRVIGASGKLVGYAGGLEIKKRLLQRESILI